MSVDIELMDAECREVLGKPFDQLTETDMQYMAALNLAKAAEHQAAADDARALQQVADRASA